jgi:Rrf2 family protein
MAASTKFAVAVHILTLLAMQRDEALTSEYIAGSVITNPVVVRRLLGLLREAGVVTAIPGPGGGFQLAVEPGLITLRRVYEIVEARDLIAIHDGPNPKCPVGRHIAASLTHVTEDAEEAMLQNLGRTTLARMMAEIEMKEAAVR